MTPLQLNDKGWNMLDEIAMELFVKSAHQYRHASIHELQQTTKECYRKAAIFLETRERYIRDSADGTFKTLDQLTK